MLRHVLIFTLKTDDPAEKAEQIAEIRTRLVGLMDVIPEIKRMEVPADSTGIDRNGDFAIDSDFDDEEGLRAYVVHPAHVEVAQFIGSLVASRAAIDFTV
ncbi:Dabb family protein [Schumannella sp. 10F1B-5-1]|uniref:Dabb family protein n=1 Tax=Schumannella sp. 10F1B-5-1 TaxID=2590780 RepID=UPI0011318D9C|nr:Dabb family protein [Schumannella sp. 10F1B-5-1]TPW76900.1 Dabb family protein [Schumannella sp. 10F1B-5-1]